VFVSTVLPTNSGQAWVQKNILEFCYFRRDLGREVDGEIINKRLIQAQELLTTDALIIVGEEYTHSIPVRQTFSHVDTFITLDQEKKEMSQCMDEETKKSKELHGFSCVDRTLFRMIETNRERS
jgi:hypothetical protein